MTLTNKKSAGLTVIIFGKLVQPLSRQLFGLENSAFFTNITLLKESQVNFIHNKLILPTVTLLGLTKFPGDPPTESIRQPLYHTEGSIPAMQAVDRQGALFQLINNSHDASDLLLFCSPFSLTQS